MNQESLDVKLARLETLLSQMKSSLDDLHTVDRNMTELNIHMANAQKSISLLFDRHDTVKEVSYKAHDKIDAMNNRAKGVFLACAVFAAILQALPIGTLIWTINQMSKIDTATNIVTRLEKLENNKH